MSTSIASKDREARRREKQRQQADPKKVARAKLTAPPTVIEILTTQEAADYLKLSHQYLENARWRSDGSGPDYVRLGRSVRYLKSVLDAWVIANVVRSDEPNR